METPDATDGGLAKLVTDSVQRIEAQRRDYADRSRRLNNFFVRTMTDQTGAIIRRERVQMVDFVRLAQIIEGEPPRPTEGERGRWRN